MATYNLANLIGFNFGALAVDSVALDASSNAPGQSYVVTPADFAENLADPGFGTVVFQYEQVVAATNGTNIDGSALSNPNALGQIEVIDMFPATGGQNPAVVFDVLGYSADGTSILVGNADDYEPNTGGAGNMGSPQDPYAGNYYVIANRNIDLNATPSLAPATTQTFNPTNTYTGGPITTTVGVQSVTGSGVIGGGGTLSLPTYSFTPSTAVGTPAGGSAADLVTVTNALIGTSAAAGALTSVSVTPSQFMQGDEEYYNQDGSYTVTNVGTVVTTSGTFSVGTGAVGAQGQSNLDLTIGGVVTNLQVVGFNAIQNGTEILLEALKTNGTETTHKVVVNGGTYNAPTDALYVLTIGNSATTTPAANVTYVQFGTETINPGTTTVAGPGTLAVLGHTIAFGASDLVAIATSLSANLTASNTQTVDSAGSVTLTAGQTGLIDDAPGAVTVVGNGGTNETILAGSGGFTYVATGGSGTVVAGAGNNSFIVNGGNWVFQTDPGNETISGPAGTSSATISASGTPIYFGQGSSGTTVFNATGTSATLVGGQSANAVVNAGSAAILAFAGSTGTLTFNAGSGADTVVGLGSTVTLTGGATGTLYFGNAQTTYNAGTAVDTIVGLNGSVTAKGGAAGMLVFTGKAGNNQITTGSGPNTIIAFGSADSVNVIGAGADVIDASASAVTVNAVSATGTNDVFFAFGTNDVLIAGSGTTFLSSYLASQTLVGGSGTTLFEPVVGAGGRTITIENFSTSRDFVDLTDGGYAGRGFASAVASTALAGATTSNGNETLTLVDGTQLTFINTTGLTSGSFI